MAEEAKARPVSERMRRDRGAKSAALLVFVSLMLFPGAAIRAQQPATEGAAEVTGIRVTTDTDVVRIEVSTSGRSASPGSVTKGAEGLILELPGVTYTKSARRIVVNRDGVKDVRIWLQTQEPPHTRISVELDHTEPYDVSADESSVVLRIGAGVKLQSETKAAATATDSTAAVDSTMTASANKQAGEASPASSAGETSAAATTSSAPAVQVANAPAASAATKLATPAEAKPAAPSPEATTAKETTPKLQTSAGAAAKLPAPQQASPAAPAGAGTGSRATPGATPAALGATGAAASGTGQNLAPASAFGAAPNSPATNANPAAAAAAAPESKDEPAARVGGKPASTADVAIAQAAPDVPNQNLRQAFKVKFVQPDVAYLDGGRSAGLAEGMKLDIRDNAATGNEIVAELTIIGVAETSAVAEIHNAKRDVAAGDIAYLSSADTEALVQQHALGAARQYPAVISFTEGGDALDQEAHAAVPRPPMPSVNRAQGRIGLDYMSTTGLGGTGFSSRDVGAVLRVDYTRIGGSYWNLNGYWMGRINAISSTEQTQTLQDLMNRTYHLGFTYDNPDGKWVAGVGRIYVPWASSLDTIDGGYFGRRVAQGVIVGMFAGSTPDPTSWNYNPNLRITGTFVNFEGGSFDAFHYSSTSGAGVSFLQWQVNRPFLFFENSITYRHNFSIYHALQADSPAGNPAVAAPGPGIGESLLSIRWSPIERVELDGNDAYFREIPTFDPTLVGTGLLDKYLFQGFSAGIRVETIHQISVYTEQGLSNRTGDTRSSPNQMYGITFARILRLGLRADAHYSQFSSSFGAGSYRAVTLSRDVNERMELSLIGGDQTFTSTLAGNQSAKFVTATMDSSLGALLFFQGEFTIYRGQLQSYNQWLGTIGYRFDTKRTRR